MADVLSFAGGLLRAWPVALLVAELLALLTVPSVLIRRRGRPVAALAWLLALLTLPGLGLLAWWAVARANRERRPPRKASARAAIDAGLDDVRERTRATQEVAPAIVPIVRLPSEEAAGLYPVVRGNRVGVLRDAAEAYPAMERVIRDARRHIHVLMYQFFPDGVGRRFRDLLAERARAGVEVRVLADAVGSLRLTRSFMAPLTAAGGRFGVFMPNRILRRSLTLNFRNHRKIVVADGGVAYTGGLNIGESYARDWHDVGVLVAGPLAAQLQEVFAEDWYFATGENLADERYFNVESAAPETLWAAHEADGSVVASGPDTPQNITQDVLFIAIGVARRRIFVATPYLAPNPAMLAALRGATYRGLDVRLLVPRLSDVPLATLAGRSYYPELLAAGVRVFEHLPGVLHSKLWVIDDDLSIVGSANLDSRSFRLNFESSCCMRSRTLNEEFAGLFLAYLVASQEISADQLQRRPRLQLLKEAAANLLAPLL
jgi:cardiolipin synthase A/B